MPANEIPANEMHICFNCFRERPDLSENPEGRGPCPYCGFDLEENVKRLQAAGMWSEKAEANAKAIQAAEMWSESKHQDYQSEQKDTKRKSWVETGSNGE